MTDADRLVFSMLQCRLPVHAELTHQKSQRAITDENEVNNIKRHTESKVITNDVTHNTTHNNTAKNTSSENNNHITQNITLSEKPPITQPNNTEG